MTDSASNGSDARIPAALQRRAATPTSGAKILALGASVAAGISLVGAMTVGAQPDPAVLPAAQEQVIVVRVQAAVPAGPTTAVPTAAPTKTAVPVKAAPAPAPRPDPTTVSEGS